MISPQSVDFLKSIQEFFTRFGLVDIILIIFLFVGLLRGYRKGLAILIGNLVQILLMITIALEYTEPIAQLVPKASPVVDFIAHTSVFILIVFGCYQISKFLLQGFGKILTIHFTDLIDKIGGLLTGGTFFLLILSFFTYFLLFFPGTWIRDSYEKYNLSGAFLIRLTPDVHQVTRRIIPAPLRSSAEVAQPK